MPRFLSTDFEEQLDGFEARIRSYQNMMATPRIFVSAVDTAAGKVTLNSEPMGLDAWIPAAARVISATFWIGGSWEDWARLWHNIGVAHCGAVAMKEIHYSEQEHKVLNEATLRSTWGV